MQPVMPQPSGYSDHYLHSAIVCSLLLLLLLLLLLADLVFRSRLCEVSMCCMRLDSKLAGPRTQKDNHHHSGPLLLITALFDDTLLIVPNGGMKTWTRRHYRHHQSLLCGSRYIA
ncbi:hypothetical protein F5Y09DRAFT_317877 [Xylaria sp. FL1042]|nr:hypothetical protein F5Y09DRAFT_317877 [Xylaria sp. FL1042]